MVETIQSNSSKFSLFIEFLVGLIVLPAVTYYAFNLAIPFIKAYVDQVELFRYVGEGLLVGVCLYLRRWVGIGFLVTFLFLLIFYSGLF